jgi:hypothetical protein
MHLVFHHTHNLYMFLSVTRQTKVLKKVCTLLMNSCKFIALVILDLS